MPVFGIRIRFDCLLCLYKGGLTVLPGLNFREKQPSREFMQIVVEVYIHQCEIILWVETSGCPLRVGEARGELSSQRIQSHM